MGIIFYLSVCAVAMIALAALLIRQLCGRRSDGEYLHALEDALRAGGTGFLVFRSDGELEHINSIAKSCLDGAGDTGGMSSLSDFISYIYDHAAVDTMASYSQLNSASGLTDVADFRELIFLEEGRAYLVEMHKVASGRTLVLMRDVSLIKTQNENLLTLNKMNAQLNVAIQSSSCGVFILDGRDDKKPVIFMNRMCRDIAGIDDGDACLPSFTSLLLMFGKEREESIQFADEAEYEKGFQEQVVFRIDEDERWFDFRLNPVFDEDGNYHLSVGVLSEITALKIKQAEFHKAQKLEALGQLSAGIAHDFNNILSIVDGYARMTLMNYGDADKAEKYAQKISESASRGSHLTNQMMTFASNKISRGSVIDLKDLLVEQETLLRPLIHESIRFEIECEGDELYGYCNGDSLVQILMNLIINACDAMDVGGRLNISLAVANVSEFPAFIKDHSKEYLCLKVRDDGCGMPEDVRCRVFDPFFTTKPQGQGTGLGLSVIYGLVKDMKGYIDVQSEPSKGTEFSIFIPRSQDAPQSYGPLLDDNKNAININLSGLTAMIVEDEDELRNILIELLEGYGMTVLALPNAEEALQVENTYMGDIDLLLTDMVMPGVNGYLLAKKMRAAREGLSVIFMSGYPAKGSDAEVEMRDDDVFLSKPLDFNVLSRSLCHVLGREKADMVSIKKVGKG